MGGMCGCLEYESEPPIPLDAEIVERADVDIGLVNGGPQTQRILGFPLFGARRPNFDFITHDNGETYIATFRAMTVTGKVLGYDSKPFPKAVFDEFRVIKKFKRGDGYVIRLETNGHHLKQYILIQLSKEELEKLGVKEPEINI